MTSADLRVMLTNWLEELRPWYGTTRCPDDYIFTDEEHLRYRKIEHEANPNRLHVIFFMESNEYHISATTDGYLGCIAKSRKSLPGETWFRGNDLPDGDLSVKTWDSILRAILRYEFQSMTDDALSVIRTGGRVHAKTVSRGPLSEM